MLSRFGLIACLSLIVYFVLSGFEISPSLMFIGRFSTSARNAGNVELRGSATAGGKISNASESETVNSMLPLTTVKAKLPSELPTTQQVDALPQPKEAFVTFSNNAPTYLALLKVLLDSVHAFSTRPIIAYGIDVDLNIDVKEYPRVIKRRIKQSDCGPVIGFFAAIIRDVHGTILFVSVGLLL